MFYEHFCNLCVFNAVQYIFFNIFKNKIAQGDVNIFSQLTAITPRKHLLVVKETKNHGHWKLYNKQFYSDLHQPG